MQKKALAKAILTGRRMPGEFLSGGYHIGCALSEVQLLLGFLLLSRRMQEREQFGAEFELGSPDS